MRVPAVLPGQQTGSKRETNNDSHVLRVRLGQEIVDRLLAEDVEDDLERL